MTTWPITCKYCQRRRANYGACICPDARLAEIDAERKQIEKRQDELDTLERDILGLRPSPSISRPNGETP